METNNFIKQLSNFNINLSDIVWTEDDTEAMYSELLNEWFSTLSDDEIINAIDENIEELDTIEILNSLDKNEWLGEFLSWVFQKALGV